MTNLQALKYRGMLLDIGLTRIQMKRQEITPKSRREIVDYILVVPSIEGEQEHREFRHAIDVQSWLDKPAIDRMKRDMASLMRGYL